MPGESDWSHRAWIMSKSKAIRRVSYCTASTRRTCAVIPARFSCAGVKQRQALLVPVDGEDLEAERVSARPFGELGAAQLVTGRGEQRRARGAAACGRAPSRPSPAAARCRRARRRAPRRETGRAGRARARRPGGRARKARSPRRSSRRGGRARRRSSGSPTRNRTAARSPRARGCRRRPRRRVLNTKLRLGFGRPEVKRLLDDPAVAEAQGSRSRSSSGPGSSSLRMSNRPFLNAS